MTTSNPTQIVLQLQREYRAIINQLLSAKELAAFKSASIAEKRILLAQLLSDESARVRVPGGSISPFEDRLNRIAHEVSSFWEQNGDRLSSALKASPGFKLATTVAALDTPEFDQNIRRLCVYFDTLTVLCPIHEGKDRLESRYGPREHKDLEEMRSKLHIASGLVTVILSEPLLSADTATPIIVVVPDFYAAREDCEAIDISSGSLLVEHLVGGGFTMSDLGAIREKIPFISGRYRSDPQFRAVVEEQVAAEYADYLPPALRIDGLRDAPIEAKIVHFLSNVGESTTEFNMLSTCADQTGSDPIIVSRRQRTFRGYLEACGKQALRQFDNGKENAIVAQGLLAKPMGFLEALSFEDLRIMRSEGMLEKTRESLRAERERFRRADYGALETAGNQFASRFIDIIEEAGRVHVDQDAKLRADIRKNAIYFAGGCVVGAASIALPQTLLMQAVGLGYSSVIGGSALEINSAVKARQAEKERFMRNPLGILYGTKRRAG